MGEEDIKLRGQDFSHLQTWIDRSIQ